jgi:glucose/arabinose dehydrogenase
VTSRSSLERSLLAVLGAIALPAVASGPARAAVAAAFANTVTLDPQFFSNVTDPTDIAFSADGRAIVTTKAGPLLVRHADGTVVTVAYPFPPTLDTDSEKGVLGVVADPNVAQNRAFYFYVSNGPTADKHRVYRAVLGATTDTFTVDAVPIIGAARGLGPGLEGPANHDGGGLAVSGGKLYVSVGDTGLDATPPLNKYGSCLNKGNGKILRVNLDGTIPSDNPLVSVAAASGCDTATGPWTIAAPDPRIFVWGQRNPFRVWVDPRTSLVWVGDVGETTSEEIAIYAGNQSGGYPFVEGGTTWGPVDGNTCSTLTPSRACTPPAFSYGHDVGQAVMGGVIVEGCGWGQVFGGTTYVFGDWSAGWIRALPVNSARAGFTSTTPVDFADGLGPAAFRMGPDAALYVVLENSRSVIRLAPVSRTGADCAAVAVPSRSRLSTPALALALALLGLAAVRGLTPRRRTRG